MIAMIRLLCLADLHLVDQRPECRLESEDWHKAMEAKFDFLSILCIKEKVDYVLIAGDLFDKWNISFEFYNEIVAHFKNLKNSTICGEIIAIPGNHDLPEKDYKQLNRTPYWGMMDSNVITNCTNTYKDCGINVIPYYYGKEDELDVKLSDDSYNIVMAHKGLWHKEKCFKEAKDDGNVELFIKKLPKNIDLLVAGDYHVPFTTRFKRKSGRSLTVVNCGSLMRIKADQLDYKPKVHIATIDFGGNNTFIKSFDVPIVNPIRRDHIDVIKDTKDRLDNIVASIDGNFEVTLNFRANVTNAIDRMEDQTNNTAMKKLFDKSLTEGTSK